MADGSRVRIVTDSGADLPSDLRSGGNIEVVPLTITFGDREFKDGVDLVPEDFYRRLAAAGPHEMPRTTQPSPAEFERVFRPLVEAGHAVVSIHLSGKLSGTLQSAALAAQTVGGEIHVVDSYSASLGVGLLVREGARLAAAGEGAAAIVARLRALRDRQRVFFSVDTLEYLQRNGRIGKAQAFLGSLLNVKPLLTLTGGEVDALERVRGRGKVHARLVDLVARTAEGGPARIGIVHGNAPEEAARLAEGIRARIPVEELVTAVLGPTIGTHAGPGTLGVVCQPCG